MDIVLTKDRIKDLISRKGMTFSGFAQKLGIKKQNLDAYLNTQKKDINMVVKMAEALDISLYEFVGIPEPEEKEVYGCLYVKGKPILVYSKEDIKDLLKRLDDESVH